MPDCCGKSFVSLEIEQIQQRYGHWLIADLIGKRQRIRSVPMPAWSKLAIDR